MRKLSLYQFVRDTPALDWFWERDLLRIGYSGVIFKRRVTLKGFRINMKYTNIVIAISKEQAMRNYSDYDTCLNYIQRNIIKQFLGLSIYMNELL